MEAAASTAPEGGTTHSVAKLPSRVILALDHFSPAERAAVERAAQDFAHGAAVAMRLPDPEPLYLLRATPRLLIVVWHDEGQPVVVEDIMTQEAWDRLADAS